MGAGGHLNICLKLNTFNHEGCGNSVTHKKLWYIRPYIIGTTNDSYRFKYGLGMLVDILCGIMSGSNNGPNIRHWNNYVGEVANLGHFFVAIDPDYFAPDFKDRLQVIFFCR